MSNDREIGDRPWYRFYEPQVPRTIEYPELNLYQMFQFAVEENPGGTAMLFYGKRWTYRQLSVLVDAFADRLASLGIRKGDRVALVLPNIPGYPIAHFATAKLGAILVPTNPLYVERELENQLNDSGAETVVILDRLLSKLERVRGNTGVRYVIVMEVEDFLPRPLNWLSRLKRRRERAELKPLLAGRGVLRYSAFMKRKAPRHPGTFVPWEETALLLYTGGTTGVSKGAELTHRNVVVNAYQTRHWLWSMEEGKEVILCVLPFFHSYGMTTGLHLAVVVRCTMLLLPRFDLPEVAKQIRRYKPTIFCAVPAMYNAINRYQGLSAADVSSIKLCVSGGAPLPAEVQERFEAKTGGKLVEGYGLTETSPVAVVNPLLGRRKVGTIGIPISDTDARVVDPETGEPLPPGEVGELAIRGPQVMKGYWRKPDETALVLRDGWLYTGDMAVMDEEGYFRIVDRKKDVIISAGMNIYPREIEEVLLRHPKIAEAAVVGVPSKVRDETVKAFIVPEPGSQLTKAEVLEYLQDKLARYKIPKQFEFVEALPKSALGKVLKRELVKEKSAERGVQGQESGGRS